MAGISGLGVWFCGGGWGGGVRLGGMVLWWGIAGAMAWVCGFVVGGWGESDLGVKFCGAGWGGGGVWGRALHLIG